MFIGQWGGETIDFQSAKKITKAVVGEKEKHAEIAVQSLPHFGKPCRVD